MKQASPPSRICIDARFYRKSTAGVGRYTRALIHNLQKIDDKNKYTVILTPADYAEWPTQHHSDYAGWQVEVLDIPHYSVAEQTKLFDYLQKQRFDLVHFTMFNHPIFYTKPYVVTIHDLTMTIFPLRSPAHPRTWAYRFIMRDAAQMSQHILSPSQATKSDIHAMLHIAKEKITVTHEAVEDSFKPTHDKEIITRLREKYTITKPFLFFVNAWRPHKGLPDLINVFAEVKKEHDIGLVLAGQPDPAFPQVIGSVRRAQENSGDIITPGFIPDEDMVPLYSMAEAFVFPSHYEGFGLGALEAISCGCPTIAAQNSSLPEVLGDAALYFPTGNIEKLAETIRRLLTDTSLQTKLREAGLKQARQFSFTKMAEETLGVYEKVLKA